AVDTRHHTPAHSGGAARTRRGLNPGRRQGDTQGDPASSRQGPCLCDPAPDGTALPRIAFLAVHPSSIPSMSARRRLTFTLFAGAALGTTGYIAAATVSALVVEELTGN